MISYFDHNMKKRSIVTFSISLQEISELVAEQQWRDADYFSSALSLSLSLAFFEKFSQNYTPRKLVTRGSEKVQIVNMAHLGHMSIGRKRMFSANDDAFNLIGNYD